MTPTRKNPSFQFILWILTGIIGLLAYREFLQINVLAYVGTQDIWSSRRYIAFILFSAFSLLVYLTIQFSCVKAVLNSRIARLQKIPFWLKSIFTAVMVLFPGLIKWTLPLPENFTIGFWMEFFLMFIFSILSVTILSNVIFWDWMRVLRTGCFMMAAGAAHSILYKFNSITSFPFTLYWSEGNRFFDYSTLLGSFRYILPSGEKINAFISWGMQLPWALPFIFPGISIRAYRFWYQLVWIIPSLILGLTAIRRTTKSQVSLGLLLASSIWTYLFLDQGPIYSPLIIGAVLTVIAARQKILPGMLLVFIASYYTRSARWTWSYAPGIWAGMLALFSISQPGFSKEKWRELVKPVTLGIAGYLGGQLLPSLIRMISSSAAIQLLPNPTASTTRQPLLWSRLYPNPTFPPGILGALAWAALPLIALILMLLLTKKWRINWLQIIAVIVVTATFLVVGIIASVKIGGGSNLHNLDIFLVSLVLIATAVMNDLRKEKEWPNDFHPLIYILAVFTLIAPITYTMRGGERLQLPSEEKIAESLSAVQNKVEEFSRMGEVLFIDHRQLLTFNLVENVPLVDKYEKKYLMDQAMAANSEYFKEFYMDLINKRFALIVNEPSNVVIRGSEYSFGEENDAYVKWVTKPILCTYEPIYTSLETSLQLLIPRNSPPPVDLGCTKILNP